MTNVHEPAHCMSRQAGLSAVETTISLAILVAIVVLAGGAVTSITNIQRQSQTRLQAERTARDLLNRLRTELQASTQDKDPLNDLYRFESLVDAQGRSVIRFQMMNGSHMEGTELVPDWSGWVEYRVGLDHVVTRTLDGETMTVASGVDRLALAAMASGRFEVTCTVTYRDPHLGTTVTRTEREFVKPLN